MRRPFFLCVLFCLALAWGRECHAVVIFVKGSEQPVMGFLVQESTATVIVDEVQADGTRRKRAIPRATIEDILYTVQKERLEALDYGEPNAYRTYAEELTEKRQDPEARATAIRLYLIAAHLAPDELGRPAMLGLISLARDEQEEAKFRAMAYLLDPEHDERILARPDITQVEPEEITKDARQNLLDAMRQMRNGRRTSARQLLDSPDVRAALENLTPIITHAELVKACSTDQPSSVLLEKMVKLELSLLPGADLTLASTAEASQTSWRQAVHRDGLAPVPPLTLETLTEFDPRKCHYRDGEWVEPS